MVTNSATSSALTVDPTMGSFLHDETKSFENIEKELLKVEMEIPSYTAIVGTLKNTIEQALAAPTPSDTELRYHKTIVISQKGKVNALLQKLARDHSDDRVVAQRIQEATGSLQNLVTDLTSLEERLPKNNEESGSQVVKIEPTQSQTENKPKLVDGIRPKTTLIPDLPKEQIAEPTPITQPVVETISTKETVPTISTPVTLSTSYVKYGQKPPEKNFTSTNVTPVTVTQKVETVVPKVEPVPKVIESITPETTTPQTTSIADEVVKKETFDVYGRFGEKPPVELPVQKAIDLRVTSSQPEESLARIPKLDSTIEAAPSIRKLLDTLKTSLGKSINMALLPVVLLVPPANGPATPVRTNNQRQVETFVTQPTTIGTETKFMFNLLSPEDQKNVLLFALDPKNFAGKTLGIDEQTYDGIISKTADGTISPYKILNDENLNGLYIMVNGTQKDVRKEASEFTQAIITIAERVQAPNAKPKEVGAQSMKEYVESVQQTATKRLQTDGII